MNSPHPSERIKEIFEHALEQPTPQSRLEYAQQACGGDADLLARVQTLLHAYDATSDFLPANPAGAPTAGLDVTLEEKPGSQIGHYKLLQQIGEGGCGVVYMAEQEQPVRRRVALKVIKLGMDTKAVVARFEAERQALAMMDHPNIAKVFDAGTTANGRPYFVMELVRGIPITKYCDENNLPTAARLELFGQVCHAIQHAHQKGIIHRDIKPSNILVTMHDGVPVPKVIDFGIAKATQGKLTDQTLFTAFEQFIGTPAYMSPEQAEMSGLDIDTRSDIYSLGVLLYELLTGQPPFDPKRLVQAGIDEIRRQIREVEPPRPSTRLATLTTDDRTVIAKLRGTAPGQLSSQLSGDLDWIVMKALEKNRTRRYESASAFAADLQRHLQNEPVTARPPSTAYLLQKLVRRHRVACVTGFVILVTLIAALAVSTVAYFREKAAHDIAVSAAVLQKQAVTSALSYRVMIGDFKRELEAKRKQSAIDQARGAEAVGLVRTLLTGLLADENHSPRSRDDLRRLLEPTERRALATTGGVPAEARQEICLLVGDAFLALGDEPRAERLYRAAYQLCRDCYGDLDPATKTAAEKLLQVLRREGKQRDLDGEQKRIQGNAAAYRHTDHWINALKAEARKLRDRGRYGEAEARLHEAIEAARDNPKYDPYVTINEIARLRLDAGDTAGAQQLSRRWLADNLAKREWGWAGCSFFLVRPPYEVPFDAYATLGLAALKAGDHVTARLQLVHAAESLTEWQILAWGKNLGGRQLELAAALAAAGDRDAAIAFLERLRDSYLTVYQSQDFTWMVSDMDWKGYFDRVATGNEFVLEMDGWLQELRSGRIPSAWLEADWRKAPPTPALDSPLPPLASIPAPPPAASGPLHSPALPLSLLVLGWFSAAVAPWMRSPAIPQGPTRASYYLLLFCLARTIDCFVFALMLMTENFHPSAFLIFVVNLAGWTGLWLFARALTPNLSSRREAVIFWVIFTLILFGAVLFKTGPHISHSQDVAVAAIGGMTVSSLLTCLIALIVGVVAGTRVWRWTKAAPLTPGRRRWLQFAAPLLVVHGPVYIAMPLISSGAPLARGTFLILDIVLPWLLALAFFQLPPSNVAHTEASVGAR